MPVTPARRINENGTGAIVVELRLPTSEHSILAVEFLSLNSVDFLSGPRVRAACSKNK